MIYRFHAGSLKTIAAVVFPRQFRRAGLLVVPTNGLAGYFDESGTGRSDGVLVVAGYVAPVANWMRFEREWTDCIARARLDPKEPFHRTVFEARKQPWMQGKPENHYAWMSDSEADDLVDGLGMVIQRSVIGSKRMPGIGVACSVVIDDYAAVHGDQAFPVDRYSFCVLQCLTMVTRWTLEIDIKAPVAYIFEDGASGLGLEQSRKDVNASIARLFDDAAFREKYNFRSLSFESKRDFPQLQAADFAAWDLRRTHREEAHGLEHYRGARNAFTVRHFDKEALERFRASFLVSQSGPS